MQTHLQPLIPLNYRPPDLPSPPLPTPSLLCESADPSTRQVNDMITGMEEKLAEIEQRQHSVSQQKESLEKDREAVAVSYSFRHCPQ